MDDTNQTRTMPDPADPDPGPLTWRKLTAGLYRHARALGAPPEEAEDLVHDALEVYASDPSWYDPARGPLLRVLKVVITNRVRDRFRKGVRRGRVRGHLRLVARTGSGPDVQVTRQQAADLRDDFLRRLTPAERSLFQAWLSQQHRELDGPAAAASLRLTYSEYEAAKKRLRRRCRVLLAQMSIQIDDLFDPQNGAP